MRWTMLLLLLSACAQPLQISDPVMAEVPVAVSCNLAPAPEPDWNVSHLAGVVAPTDALKAVLADMDLSKGYIHELKAELKACS